MKGQKLGNRSRLGERQGHWITHSLTESLTHSLSTEKVGAGAVCCQFKFQILHETSQDGSSLEFVVATQGRECQSINYQSYISRYNTVLDVLFKGNSQANHSHWLFTWLAHDYWYNYSFKVLHFMAILECCRGACKVI